MNADHLRPVLQSHVHSDLLFKLGEQLSRAETFLVIMDVRLGRITTLQKPQRRSEGDRGGRHPPEIGVPNNRSSNE